MIKVVFVGDQPSTKNISPNIPFVGASCFIRLVDWIKQLNPDYYITLNSHLNTDLLLVSKLAENDFKVIALGKNAAKELADCGIDHFTLPHPSPLNRKINNQEEINKLLTEAKNYIQSRK